MVEKTTWVRTDGEKARSDGQSTQELRQGIEETRAEMTETLVAIEARLNPTTVKRTVTEGFEAAKEVVREQLHEATIGKVENMVHKAERTIDDVRGSVVDTIRENPIPAILTGVGLAWLLMNRRSRSTGRRLPEMRGYVLQGSRYGEPGREAPGYLEEGRQYVEEGRQKASEIAEQVREGAGQIAEKVQSTAQDVSQRVQEKAHEVSERAKETSGRVAERAEQVAHEARVQARRLEERVEQSFSDNPMGFAALAIAAGAALGLALPRTQREDELMGGSRDRLLEKAQSSAEGAVQKAEQVAKAIVSEPQRVMGSEEARAERTAGESPR